jgi:hypothetical protein
MPSATFSQTFNSFCGVDMLITFGGQLIGEVQGLSFSITREKAPLYTMGSANPRSFSRGKRGIAGALIMLVFDRSAMLDILGPTDKALYVANEYEVRPDYRQTQTHLGNLTELNDEVVGSFGVPQAGGRSGLNYVGASKVLARAQYHDQILPFNITVTAANEYGHVMSMHILGVEIMNCGSGFSIDDITIDESCTFVCTDVLPWSNQKFIRHKIEDARLRQQSPRSGGGIV